MRKKYFIMVTMVVLLLAGMMSSIFGCAETEQEAKTLDIGTIMPISGALSSIGEPWNRGYELAAEMINGKGGIKINGETYMINLLEEDGKMSTEACSAAANKLVYQDGVKFIFGEIMDADAAAIYEVTRPAGVWLGEGCAVVPVPIGSWGPGEDKPLLVQMFAGIPWAYDELFDYAKESYPDCTDIVACDNTSGHEGLLNYHVDQLGEYFNVVGTEFFDLTATDFYPFMTAVLGHNPDIISIANMLPAILPEMVRTARELGFEGPIISACIADPTYALEGAGATMANDILCLAVYALGDDVPAAMKDVVNAWEAKYPGEPFSSDALWAYDELWVLAQVMEKAQSLDPEVIMSTLENMDELGDIETTFGPGYFGGENVAGIGVNRVIIRPLAISLIKDGEITNVLWPLSEVGKGLE